MKKQIVVLTPDSIRTTLLMITTRQLNQEDNPQKKFIKAHEQIDFGIIEFSISNDQP